MRVLNCSVHEELQALRHAVIASTECCEVISPPSKEALSRLQNHERFDVLVVCYQVGDHYFADQLCTAFRRANSEGRIVGIVGSPLAGTCEADVTVESLQPDQLIAAVTSYPAWRAKFHFPRRLTFVGKSGTFRGWSCERCCWTLRLEEDDPDDQAEQAVAQFDRHSCERFARANWDSTLLADVSEKGNGQEN